MPGMLFGTQEISANSLWHNHNASNGHVLDVKLKRVKNALGKRPTSATSLIPSRRESGQNVMRRRDTHSWISIGHIQRGNISIHTISVNFLRTLFRNNIAGRTMMISYLYDYTLYECNNIILARKEIENRNMSIVHHHNAVIIIIVHRNNTAV